MEGIAFVCSVHILSSSHVHVHSQSHITALCPHKINRIVSLLCLFHVHASGHQEPSGLIPHAYNQPPASLVLLDSSMLFVANNNYVSFLVACQRDHKCTSALLFPPLYTLGTEVPMSVPINLDNGIVGSLISSLLPIRSQQAPLGFFFLQLQQTPCQSFDSFVM